MPSGALRVLRSGFLMRIGKMSGRRVPARRAYRGADWNAALRSLVLRWLAVAGQAPVAQWSWEQRRSLAEVALYVGAYLAYVFSRGLVYDNPRAVGTVNGGLIADFQQRAGFLWEPGWQAWAMEHVQGMVVFLNWAYIITYWPVILGLAIYLFLRDRSKYYYYRTVVLLNLIVALIAFMVFPVASPFAIPGVDLLDSIQLLGPSFYGSATMANFYNTSAAMPSLHFSWTVILGVYWLRSLPGGFKAAGVVYPALTFFAITITGNHFILDAIAGGVLAGLSFGAVEAYRLAKARAEAGELRTAWVSLLRRMKLAATWLTARD